MACLPERIETPRLTLRLWELSDAPALNAAVEASLEHLRPWMAWIAEEPITVAQREARFAEWRQEWFDGGDALYGVFADGEVVGGTGLHRRIGHGGLEIGYWIHVDHVGQGYATELARGLTTAGLAHPGVERVEIHHDRGNVISGRVPQRLGYTWMGGVERAPRAPGESGVGWTWQMLPDEWDPERPLPS